MNEARLLLIASRIDLLLQRELGQGIDPRRMVRDALYARDVLLVCEAQPGSSLDSLARHFRAARRDPMDTNGQPSTFGDSSSFATSTSPASLDDTLPIVRQTRLARWLSPSRWLGR